ncbi:retrovirus-related pol polyprotein from transposon TNT 1-94 [Tanacetum coccineum]
MHNNIMAAGSKDRPPMLGPGRYSQWHSRFLRYLDTKSNGEYLRKCIFEGPYMPTNVLIAAVEAAEAIFLILTGIGDEIYSTVDACNTSKEMWTAIERLQQGESLNVQDEQGLEDTTPKVKKRTISQGSWESKADDVVGQETVGSLVDQNAAECVDERAALANLIANLTLDTEENKMVLKQLKKANASLTQELKFVWFPYAYTSDPANRFCPDGEETVTLEKESRSKLDKDKVKPYNYTYQNSLYETFKPPSKTYLDQLERAKEVRKTMWRKTFVRTKPNIAKNVGFLPMSKSISKSRLLYNEMTNNFNHFRTICQQTWSNHTSSAFPNPTAKTMEVLIKTLLMPLSNKTILDSHCFIHELKREMNDDLEYVNSLEKELDELESEKADFSNIYDLLLEECVSKDSKNVNVLEQKLSDTNESVNKEVHNKLLKSFAKLGKTLISLELSLQLIRSLCRGLLVASKPKRKVNKSVATPHTKTVALDTTIQKSKSYYKELYENTNQEWKWWIAKRCPSGYTWTQKPLRTKKIWMPKIRKDDESTSISPTIDIVSRITNVLKISNSLGSNLSNVPSSSNSLADCTVRFGNDQFAPILGYGDLIQGNVTIKRIYYVEGLNHNLFSVGQFCDADLEVAFRKSTCFVRDLQGNDLLTGSRGSDLYTISLQETTSSTPICFMAKASPTQAWLWHRRLSHLNFDYITLLSKKDVVTGP